MKNLFKIGGTLPSRTILIIEILGLIFFLVLWYFVTYPVKTQSLQFKTIKSEKQLQFVWNGPNNYKEHFNGDNLIENISAGVYRFTAKDSVGNKVSDSIVVQKSNLVNKVFKNNNIEIAVDITETENGWFVSKSVLPPPLNVIKSYYEMHFDSKGKVRQDSVLLETLYSVKLNLLGYIEAILLSIIFGFLIGLIPFFRAWLSRYVNATRFVPLTAVIGIFIAWFGIETNMKVQFLAFGIFVYLLPVVVQRIDELEKIYLQTAYTLGASTWQTIRNIYWPHVSSKLIDDVRVLTAISWTYIIIAELLNQTGGIGALIHLAGRQNRLDKVFALLLIIIFIGILQDRLFVWLDKVLFPHKTKK